MTYYSIRVTAYIPYPISREYSLRASNYAVVASKALKAYRKEERVKGKRFDRVTVQISKGVSIGKSPFA